jgi:phosphomannomutase
MGLFGTSGVRGLTGTEITPKMVERIACGFVRELEKGGVERKLCVAHDTRERADEFASVASIHVSAHRWECEVLGVQPAGVICDHIIESKCDGGIFVTGSHLPQGHIGIILLDRGAGYVGGAMAERIETSMKSKCSAKNKVGKVSERGGAAIAHYANLVTRLFPKKIHLHVAIDPCCGSSAGFASEVMKNLCGVTVSPINNYRSHRFPREPEPRSGSTLELQSYVRKAKANLGAAFDIDADRVLLMDESGEPISEDVTGALLARHTLKKGDSCTAPINSSSIIEETCRKMGVRFEHCGIGQPKIVEKMREMGASYAYEESGKYYVKHQPFACGILTTLAVAEIIAISGISLSEHVKGFPRPFMFKKGFECPNSIKEKVMEKVLERWDCVIGETPVKEITLEGMKKVYGDGSWVMIRASGTEPKMRIYLEGKSEKRRDALAGLADALVQEALKKGKGKR